MWHAEHDRTISTIAQRIIVSHHQAASVHLPLNNEYAQTDIYRAYSLLPFCYWRINLHSTQCTETIVINANVIQHRQ